MLSIGLLLCSAGCGNIPVKNYDYTTNGTDEIMTYQAFYHDADCASKSSNIRFIEKPSNGTITIKNARKTITNGADGGVNQNCAGKPVIGREIYYTAKEGFSGIDEFVVEISSTGIAGTSQSKITVNVQ